MQSIKKQRAHVDAVTFATDPQLLGLTLSPAQEVVIRAAYGLPIEGDLVSVYYEITGRLDWRTRTEPVHDLTVIGGRRGGKDSRIITAIAAYEAFCGGHEAHLAPGEEGVVLVVSQVIRRARQAAFSLIRGAIFNSPMLRKKVISDRAWDLGLDNGLVIRCEPCSFRSIRGSAVPVALFDEAAFWSYEGHNPDREVERAVRPAMAQFPGWKLVKVSTPWIRAGLLFEDYEKHYGADEDPHLVMQASTWILNPTIPQSFLDQERRKDPETFEREYGARFSDREALWLPHDSIEACRQEWTARSLPEYPRPRAVAVIDPAYKRDRFAAAIGWYEKGKDEIPGRVVIGRLEGWTPPRGGELSLNAVLDQLCPILGQYDVRKVHGDQYTAAPVREALRARGFAFEEHPFSAPFKAEIYSDLKSLVIEERIDLPDHDRGISELKSLHVTHTPAGTMRIGAPERAGYHDDYATVIALAAHLVFSETQTLCTRGGQMVDI